MQMGFENIPTEISQLGEKKENQQGEKISRK
jgi:hypothetical protein